ncbi:MAG: transposase [Lewinellaceae bacterium]|nr:transposase [Lewinellaceae bacterium]
MKHTTTNHHYAELHADNIYHIYNRTNNRELLFQSDDDRKFFLKRYQKYISPCADTYAFSLLPNHFHFLIKVKNQGEIIAWIENLNLKDRTKTQKALLTADIESRTVHKVLENQFLRLFTSYAVVFNDRHQRDGNLFNRPFKRIEVENEGYFTYLIYYIHFNPQKHGIVSDFTSYYWSSYRIFLSSAPTHLFRKEVLEWFGGLEAFIQFHRMDEGFEKISGLIVEDE